MAFSSGSDVCAPECCTKLQGVSSQKSGNLERHFELFQSRACCNILYLSFEGYMAKPRGFVLLSLFDWWWGAVRQELVLHSDVGDVCTWMLVSFFDCKSEQNENIQLKKNKMTLSKFFKNHEFISQCSWRELIEN